MGLLPTAFAWSVVQSIAGYAEGFPPPAVAKGERFGSDEQCWLCGGPTHGVGWPWKTAITPTFTNHNNAAALASRTLCQPCVAMQSKETWEAYVAARPDAGLKTGHAVSWRCYSHAFHQHGHECPSRAAWREWLLDPPAPPFLFALAVSAQKHIIFRAPVAHDRTLYPVQLEEDTVWIDGREFATCLHAFEVLYGLGFSKDQILSGHYHPAQAIKVGVRRLRAADEPLQWFRARRPGYMRIAHCCARRPEGHE